MSHIWMCHVTHMNESCHTYEWVMSHIWVSHVTHMNVSCHTYEWVMSHIWMCHVTHMNEPYATYMHIFDWPHIHNFSFAIYFTYIYIHTHIFICRILHLYKKFICHTYSYVNLPHMPHTYIHWFATHILYSFATYFTYTHILKCHRFHLYTCMIGQIFHTYTQFICPLSILSSRPVFF